MADKASRLPDGAASDPSWARQLPAQFLLERRDNVEGQTRGKSVYGKALTLEHDADGPRIRLLRIQPGAKSEPLYCELITRPLFEGQVRYIALSYSWGTQPKSQYLYFGAERFAVSSHLYSAIRHLRDRIEYIDAWIDAVCINQENNLERTAQVQIMAQIYNEATEVRVWLGMPERKWARDDNELMWALSLQEHPWWKRLWVLQECAYAETCPVVVFGQQHISLKSFVERWTRVVEWHHEANDPFQRLALLQNNLGFVQQLYDIWKEQSTTTTRMPLLARLRQTARREYTMPHDRIFAILSLLGEVEGQAIVPDYRQSYSSLRSTCEAILRKSPDWNEEHDMNLLSERNSDPEDMKDALCQASRDGNTATVSYILRNRPEIGRRDALEQSALQGHTAIVFLILENHVDTGSETQQDLYRSALHIALRNEHIDLLESLLACSGSSERAVRDVPQNVFERGTLDLAKLMLKRGIDMKYYQTICNGALRMASTDGDTDVAKLLIQHGANINTLGDRYGTSLQTACIHGNVAMVNVLLEYGANVDAHGQYDRQSPALQDASAAGDAAIVKILLEHGAEVHAYHGGKHGTALLAASAKGHLDVVKLLFKYGAAQRVWRSSHLGEPLHLAAANGQVAVVKFLLSRKDLIVDRRDESDGTALSAAIRNGHLDVVKLLLEKRGIDLEMLLIQAVQNNSAAIVKLKRVCRDACISTEELVSIVNLFYRLTSASSSSVLCGRGRAALISALSDP